MKIETATKTLDAKFRGQSWYLFAGHSNDTIFVYAKLRPVKYPKTWQGYRVFVNRTSAPRPA